MAERPLRKCKSVSTATLMPSNYKKLPLTFPMVGCCLYLWLLDLRDGDFREPIQPPRFRPSR